MLGFFLGIYALWKLNRTQAQLDRWIRTELAPTDSTSGLKVDNLRISALDGEIRFEKISYYSNIDSMLYSIDLARIQIGRWSSLKMAIMPAAYVLNTVDRTNVRVTDVSLFGGEKLVDEFEMIYSGNPLQLILMTVQGRFPDKITTLNVSASNISEQAIERVPLLNNVQGTGAIDRFHTTLSIDPLIGTISTDSLIVSFESLDIRGHVQVHYVEPSNIFYPSRLELDLKSTRIVQSPGRSDFSILLGDSMGQLTFRELELNINTNFTTDSTETGDKIVVLNETQLRGTMFNPVYFPAPESLGQLGNILDFFQVPSERFDFDRLTIDMLTDPNGTLDLRSVILHHAVFVAELNGKANKKPEQPYSDAPINGTLTLSQLSPQLQNIAANIEFLFNVPMNRAGGNLQFSIFGTLGSPTIR